jgi:uncharacterized membrane protein YadS
MRIGMESLKSISAAVMRRITKVLFLVPAVLVMATAMQKQDTKATDLI